MKLSDDAAISFEEEAARLERGSCSVPVMICECCAGGGMNVCGSCVHATSFHNCDRVERRKVWCKGTLYGGKVDYQRVLLNLHREPGFSQ